MKKQNVNDTGYVISKESFDSSSLAYKKIRESSNMKMRHISIRAVLKKYATFLCNEKQYTQQECLQTMSDITKSAITMGNATSKLSSDVAKIVVDLYSDKNYLRDLHRAVVMEILEEVDTNELPSEIKSVADEVIEAAEKDDMAKRMNEVIEREQSVPAVNVEITTDTPDDGEVAAVDINVVSSNGEVIQTVDESGDVIIKNTDDSQKPEEEPRDILEENMNTLMKHLGSVYTNKALLALSHKLDPMFVNRSMLQF